MLDRLKLKPARLLDARKAPLTGDQAWEVLASASTLIIGRGKTCVTFQPDRDSREAILDAALGRTGSLRAPALKVGDRLLIGFNEDMYSSLQGYPHS